METPVNLVNAMSNLIRAMELLNNLAKILEFRIGRLEKAIKIGEPPEADLPEDVLELLRASGDSNA